MTKRVLIALTLFAHCASAAEESKTKEKQSMNQFEKNMIAIYGDQGRQWLADLPVLVEELATKWGLSDLKPVGNLTYNYVLSGLRSTQPIIVKMGLDEEGLAREARALIAFKGPFAAELLGQQPNALLLERAIPGHTLQSYFPDRDSEAVHIACDIIENLHTAPTASTPPSRTPAERLTKLDKEWDIPEHYLQKARMLRDELLATAPASVFIHKDMHHDNILKHGDRWVIIDPKGVLGESAYEIAIFICSPVRQLIAAPDAHKIIKQRVAIAAERLSIDPRRIQNWTFIHAMLSWMWCLEDKTDPIEFVQLAKLFDSLTPMDLETSSAALQH